MRHLKHLLLLTTLMFAPSRYALSDEDEGCPPLWEYNRGLIVSVTGQVDDTLPRPRVVRVEYHTFDPTAYQSNNPFSGCGGRLEDCQDHEDEYTAVFVEALPEPMAIMRLSAGLAGISGDCSGSSVRGGEPVPGEPSVVEFRIEGDWRGGSGCVRGLDARGVRTLHSNYDVRELLVMP